MNFTHYTTELNTILKILENGIAYFPCERKVIFDFLPDLKNKGLEPQQFGAISFTDLNYKTAKYFRKEFGKYGIGVSPQWAFKHDITKVIYVGNSGSLFESCRYLFNKGIYELNENVRTHNLGNPKMAYRNKLLAMTKKGNLYSHMLTLFEFMEPENNSWQSEWRIVNDKPDYSFCQSDNIDENRAKVYENIIDPKGWCIIMNFIKIPPESITSFYCPIWDILKFRRLLPHGYKQIPIKAYLT